MPRYEDRHGSSTRLYVGHLSSRTRSRDLEHIFSRYGRVRDVDMKRDYAFVDFSDPRDADDARHYLDGKDVDGRRITVEFAKGVPRGAGGVREYVGRGPTPGSGRCFNCGIDGHWARDCKAGDWKNTCYRCGDRGHIERNCQNSPKKLTRGRSYSRSPVRSRSPRRGRSRSFSRSRSYSRSRSPVRRRRDVDHKERRSSRSSPRGESPERRRKKNRSPTPERDESPRGRSPSPPKRSRMEEEAEEDQNGGESPKETSRSPVSLAGESPYGRRNGHNNNRSSSRSRSPRDDDIDKSPAAAVVDDDDDDSVRSPGVSTSP